MLIRNFSIVAHIDHGKTTLTDRLLLKTNTISEREFVERVMDSNPIEQERGITIKLAPVRMEYVLNEALAKRFGDSVAILNLIDTPGHVDFSYEVSRSLNAVEGVILLIDATQGIQAQTLSHYYAAREQNLTIIPVLNKVDLSNADADGVTLELMDLFGFEMEEIVQVSAKTGEGVEDLMQTILERIPAPKAQTDLPFRGLVFNSFYHSHLGVVTAIRVREGILHTDSPLKMMGTNASFEAIEIGVFEPGMKAVKRLAAGEVGYIATGLKDISLAHVGDTVTRANEGATSPLPGYRPPQLMVYMDFYPVDGDEYTELADALEKLKLNDAALQFSATHSPALGNGFRVGFLGVLHADIVRERLLREYRVELITTAPSVRYEVELTRGNKVIVKSAAELPDPSMIKTIFEPMAMMTIYTPKTYVGEVMGLTEEHRGALINVEYLGERAKLTYRIPLAEIIVTYFDELKSVSSGYASLTYDLSGYEPVDAVKLSILINKEVIEALSQIVVKEKALSMGKHMVNKLKDVIPRQLFVIPIQAAVGGTILARETIKPFRKDVTAKLYGGDATRRKKLLEKQKKGKKRRGEFGQVEIPHNAFMAVLKR
jgi:GTP-binding protein LepA